MELPASKNPKLTQPQSFKAPNKTPTDKEMQKFVEDILFASKTNAEKQQPKSNTQNYEKTEPSQKDFNARKEIAARLEANAKADLSKDTGRFGLQNATQVMNHMNSEAGKRQKAYIAYLMAEIEESKKQSQREAELKRQKYHRLLAIAIFLSIMSKSAHAAKYRKMLKDFHEELKRLKKQQSTTPVVEHHSHGFRIDSFGHTSVNIHDLQKFLNTYQHKKTVLENRLAEQEQIFSEVLEKHAIHETAFQDVETFISNNDIDFPVHDMDVSADSPLPVLAEESEEHVQLLESKIEEIQAESQVLREQMQENAEMRQINHPVRCQAEACDHKIDMLQDMRDVIMGKGYFANAWGQQVSTLEEAHHVVQRGYKVELDNSGVPHLLRNGISLTELSPAERSEAQQDFSQNGKIFRPVLIRKAHQQEAEEHAVNIACTTAQISLCNEEIEKTQQQIKQLETRPQPVQDPEANVQNTLTPKCKPGNNVSNPKTEYANQLNFFRNCTVMEARQQVESKNFPEELRPDARDFFQNLKNLKPGDRIPRDVFQSFQQHMNEAQQRVISGMQPAGPTPFRTSPFR